MTAEEIRRMEERVAQVRAEMERACRAAGRAPGEVLLCAASKTQNSETVRAAAALDIDLFGENRVQELCEKYAAGAYSGKPLHFIGHLQTNKVRQVVGRACMIESVGSHRLLECVAAEAQKQGIRQDILVEINIGAETSKSGIAPEELPGLLECAHALPSLRVRGLMSIPPAADAPGASRPYFAQMRGLFERAREGGTASTESAANGLHGVAAAVGAAHAGQSLGQQAAGQNGAAFAQPDAQAQPGNSTEREQQVSEQVAFWVHNKNQNASLSVEHEGRAIQVQVSLQGNEAHVRFGASEAQARDWLGNGADQLRELLQAQGLQLAGVSVDAGGQSGSGDSARQGADAQARQGRVSAMVDAAGVTGGNGAAQAGGGRAAAGGVDLFV